MSPSEPLPRGWSIADKLFFKKLRGLLGLQRLKLFIEGSAPIRREVHEFFMSIDMPLMELYGKKLHMLWCVLIEPNCIPPALHIKYFCAFVMCIA